jgi:hypothetical protein
MRWDKTFRMNGGAGEDRTRDLLTASQALSQLSYSPTPVISSSIGPGLKTPKSTDQKDR